MANDQAIQFCSNRSAPIVADLQMERQQLVAQHTSQGVEPVPDNLCGNLLAWHPSPIFLPPYEGRGGWSACSWGLDRACSVRIWARKVNWPQPAEGSPKDTFGITWLELVMSLSFFLDQQKFVGVVIPFQEGKVLFTPRSWHEVTQYQITLFQFSYCGRLLSCSNMCSNCQKHNVGHQSPEA